MQAVKDSNGENMLQIDERCCAEVSKVSDNMQIL